MSTRLSSSLTVSFVTEDSGEGSLTAEIDRREKGLNSGLIDFSVGDSPGFLVYLPAGMSVVAVRPTLGGITSMGETTFPVEEWVTFENSNTAQTEKPIHSNLTILQAYGDSISGHTHTGSGIKVPNSVVTVAEVRYLVKAQRYRVTGVGLPVPVVVFVQGARL